MTDGTISGEGVAKLAETNPECRDLLQVQFELSTSVRYEIRVNIAAYWPDKKRTKDEQHFQKIHLKRIEAYTQFMEKHIKEDLNKRDSRLILELNELLERHSEIPVSVILDKIKRMKR